MSMSAMAVFRPSELYEAVELFPAASVHFTSRPRTSYSYRVVKTAVPLRSRTVVTFPSTSDSVVTSWLSSSRRTTDGRPSEPFVYVAVTNAPSGCVVRVSRPAPSNVDTDAPGGVERRGRTGTACVGGRDDVAPLVILGRGQHLAAGLAVPLAACGQLTAQRRGRRCGRPVIAVRGLC